MEVLEFSPTYSAFHIIINGTSNFLVAQVPNLGGILFISCFSPPPVSASPIQSLTKFLQFIYPQQHHLISRAQPIILLLKAFYWLLFSLKMPLPGPFAQLISSHPSDFSKNTIRPETSPLQLLSPIFIFLALSEICIHLIQPSSL